MNPQSHLIYATVSLLDAYDAKVRAWRQNLHTDQTIHCQVGCAHCCTMMNWISLPEAVLLFTHMKPYEKKQCQTKDRQLSHLALEILPDQIYELYRHKIGPCPFLSSSMLCRLHDVRPLSCRSVLSFFPSFICQIDILNRHGIEKVEAIIANHPSPEYKETPFALKPIVWRSQTENQFHLQTISLYGFSMQGTLPTLLTLFNYIKCSIENRGVIRPRHLNKWASQKIAQNFLEIEFKGVNGLDNVSNSLVL